MNNSSLFFDPLQTVHFLSLFTYMHKLGNILYSEQLIKEEEKHQTFSVINALYEHLDKANNETEAKQRLVQKLLEGSELYGGNKNETLDMEYVNNTLDYIITNAVFAQNGNLYGYLAEIVSLSTNLKLSVFKTKLLYHLSLLHQLKDDGDVTNLTKLATDRIAETILWPLFPNPHLFPNPEHDIELLSLKYIYALAGYNLAKSMQMNLVDIQFQKYVTLGMSIEASVIGHKLPKTVLQIFALPALIYYAKNQTKFNQQNTKNLIWSENFWSEAFLTLFSHLRGTLEMIHQEALEGNSLYQFHVAMSDFKNRTAIARDIIQRECKHLNESYTESLIEDYKTYSASTGCHSGATKLPNLETIYDAQLRKIKEKYRPMEADFIRAAFNDFPKVKDLMNSQTLVFQSYPKPYVSCSIPVCVASLIPYNPNVNFFGIVSQGQTEFYALEQNERNVSLLIQKDKKFNKRVGLPRDTTLEIGFGRIYKRAGENFESFVHRLAEIKAEEFRRQLFEYGYDRTSMEKFFEILKSFIPFYHCIKFANEGEVGLAAMSCFGDIVCFVPLAGLLKVGLKVSSVTAGRFLLASGLTLKTFTLRQAILTTMITGLREAATGFNAMVTKVLLTKQMFKSVSIAVLRSLDPGFELFGKLASQGSVLIGNVIKQAFRYISKKFPSLNFKSAKYEFLWTQKLSPKKTSNDLEILPEIQFEGREVFRFIYPGGDHPFGPKYIRLSKGYAELRRMIGFEKEIPVISRVTKRERVVFRKVDLQTEEAFGLEMKLNKEGLLENVRQPFRKHIYKIKTEGFGGRGVMMHRRESSIYTAAQLVTDAKVTRENPTRVMRHYILAVNESPTVEDLMNMKAEFVDFNLEKVNVNEFLTKDLTEADNSDLSLNKYLPTPTYQNFALDWIKTRRIDESYKQFYIRNPEEFENLLYNVNVVEIINYSITNANERLVRQYGEYYDRMNVRNIFNKYILNKAWKNVSLEDYYVLFAFIYKKDAKVLKNPTFLRKALYRLAIRQSFDKFTDDELPKVLYFLDLNNPEIHSRNPLHLRGKSTMIESMFISVGDKTKLYPKLLSKNMPLRSIEEKNVVLCEAHIDSNLLVVNLNHVFPFEHSFVIIPHVGFRIENAEQQMFFDYGVLNVVMRNEPIVKESLIARLMNEIDEL